MVGCEYRDGCIAYNGNYIKGCILSEGFEEICDNISGVPICPLYDVHSKLFDLLGRLLDKTSEEIRETTDSLKDTLDYLDELDRNH